MLNLRTGFVSPQFHVVYDDLFQTVDNVFADVDEELPFDQELWDELFRDQRERYIDDFEDDDEIPPLHPDWLEPDEVKDRVADENRRFARRYGKLPDPSETDNDIPDLTWDSNDESVDEPTVTRVVPPAAPTVAPVVPTVVPVVPVAPIAPTVTTEPPAEASNSPKPRRSERVRKPNPRYNKASFLSVPRKIRSGRVENAFLNNLDWSAFKAVVNSPDLMAMAAVMESYTDPKTGLVEDWHPLAFASLANASDNPNYNQAMNGPDADGYYLAMKDELKVLTGRGSWEIVDKKVHMKVLGSTWTFKCKRFPDGGVRKLKARFCVRGDQQIEGIDFFDTYAPVVHWSTIRLLLMTSIMMGLATSQVDYTCAFLHAPIEEEVYCEMPRGFRKAGKVLKLKRSLYGLRQSPKNFFEHLKGKLLSLGFKQSKADPCLFIHDKMICITYVDDCLFAAPKSTDITEMIARLRTECEMELSVEDDLAGFLGVTIEKRSDGSIELTQTGLIDRIISVLGLEGANTKATPANLGALGKDEDGPGCNATFSYPSVVGMLMYLTGHSRPDIGFAVHQCARYTHCPRHSHEEALKRIGRYLLGTRTRGLIIRPSASLKIDLYVDASFAGMWGYEDRHDPACTKSRTGYVLFVGGCPIVWGSKLQNEVAGSTMEAEYIAMSEAMKHLIVLKRLVVAFCRAIQVDPETVSDLMTTVFQDNSAALTLANLEPPRMTPRTKHFAIKYHWFRDLLKPMKIQIVPINTDNQIADILTKSLGALKFQEMRKKLMGW